MKVNESAIKEATRRNTPCGAVYEREQGKPSASKGGEAVKGYLAACVCGNTRSLGITFSDGIPRGQSVRSRKVFIGLCSEFLARGSEVLCSLLTDEGLGASFVRYWGSWLGAPGRPTHL